MIRSALGIEGLRSSVTGLKSPVILERKDKYQFSQFGYIQPTRL